MDLSGEEAAVLDYLNVHQGREHAISMGELAAVFDMSTRRLQQVVAHLIKYHGASIGSSTGGKDGRHGFYLITSLEDQQRAERQLEHRIISTARRLAKLRKNTPHEVLGQLILEIWKDREG